jgi:hypothetical protein
MREEGKQSNTAVISPTQPTAALPQPATGSLFNDHSQQELTNIGEGEHASDSLEPTV